MRIFIIITYQAKRVEGAISTLTSSSTLTGPKTTTSNFENKKKMVKNLYHFRLRNNPAQHDQARHPSARQIQVRTGKGRPRKWLSFREATYFFTPALIGWIFVYWRVKRCFARSYMCFKTAKKFLQKLYEWTFPKYPPHHVQRYQLHYLVGKRA